MTISTVQRQIQGDVHIISFARDEQGWANVDQVRSYFANEFLTSTFQITRMIVDLAGVASLDSASLGPLLQKFKEIQDLRGRLALCNVVSPALREIFALTKFDKVLAIYASRELALAALAR